MSAEGKLRSLKREWVVDAQGVLDSRYLPDSDFNAQWDSIVVEQQLKDELLSQAILNYTIRSKIRSARLPMHGIVLLVGPPGTGKTSLARGLASRVAEAVGGIGQFRYLEVEPHILSGAALGRSQKAVIELFGKTISERADLPLIVLLDEVETLAGDRSKMSLEANPVDVHRATDAVLAQLDYLAVKYPNLFFVATSNFPGAIDPALISRADLVRTLSLPNAEACHAILVSTIEALSDGYPGLKKLTEDKRIIRAAKLCVGLDGRQIRKAIISACARRKDLALNPALLSNDDVVSAIETAQIEHKHSRQRGR